MGKQASRGNMHPYDTGIHEYPGILSACIMVELGMELMEIIDHRQKSLYYCRAAGDPEVNLSGF